MTNHSLSTWFKNTTISDFYQKEFKQNFTNTIKLPPRTLRAFFGSTPPTDTPYIAGIETLSNSLGELAITNIVTHPMGKILLKVPFDWLESDTQTLLQRSVCEFIQNATINSTIFEILISNGITSPNFNITTQETSWFLTSDPINKFCEQILWRSGILDYKWVGEEFITQTPNDTIKIVGKVSDESLIKELEL